jgi:hypothetical protein
VKVLRGRGTVRVRLDEIEAQLLTSLFEDLAEVVEGDSFEAGDPVRERLFPVGYRDDAAASDDFRDLTETSLRTERVQRARACADDIDGAGEISLDADAAERWIQALNDLRLALGTRLHITDETDVANIDGSHPQAPQWNVYYWLTGLQDGIVRRLG